MPGTPIPLDRAALHLDVDPGGEVVLRGALASTHDGSMVDAALTTWPAEAPGGASVDAGGLVDLEAGGFHLVSRDPVGHEVHALATGGAAPACAALGVQAPCLPLRLDLQAHSRLLAVDDWVHSLKGAVTVEVIAAPAYAPAATVVTGNAPVIAASLGAVLLAGVAVLLVRRRRRFAASPAGQLRALAARIQEKLSRADAVEAAPLAPAVASAARAIDRRRLDPTTAEGKRVRDVLVRVEHRLDDARARAAADEEREVADALVRDVESAIEAAEELAPRRP